MWRRFCYSFWILVNLLLFITSATADCGCKHANRDASERKPDSLFEESLMELEVPPTKAGNVLNEMSFIPTGDYILGTNYPVFEADNESPERTIHVKGFHLDKFETSNGEFRQFVQETGYRTEAEEFGDSFVFGGFLDEATKELYHDYRVVKAEWWYKVNGTTWEHPTGPGSSIDGMDNHPVVHVSWNDAKAYCKWQRKRLPTEHEWEAACRGRKERRLFPWGDNLMPKGDHWMNIWQGVFPDLNTKEDGFEGTCPVDTFQQNSFDLYNIVGNVWEWVEDLWNENDKDKEAPERVKKGGSYLCHKDYCYRYRCAARSQNTQDSSAGNLGFRCARSAVDHDEL